MMSNNEEYNQEWIWFWRTDDDTWKLYDILDAMEIRRAEIMGQNTVSLFEGRYLLNFSKKRQINQVTGFQREIDRASSRSIWLWKDDDGGGDSFSISWNAYEPDESAKLTEAMHRGEESVMLEKGAMVYFVDLHNRVQTNIDTGRSRDIHQGKPPEYDLLQQIVIPEPPPPLSQSNTCAHQHSPTSLNKQQTKQSPPEEYTTDPSPDIIPDCSQSTSNDTLKDKTPSIISQEHTAALASTKVAAGLRENIESVEVSDDDEHDSDDDDDDDKADEVVEQVDDKELLKVTRDRHPDFICEMCNKIMREPVLTWNGASYDRHCIEKWFQENDHDFVTGEELSSDQKRLITNYAFKHVIEDWIDNGGYRR